MIITDYNKMSVEELQIVNRVLHKEYVIAGGKVVGVIDSCTYEE